MGLILWIICVLPLSAVFLLLLIVAIVTSLFIRPREYTKYSKFCAWILNTMTIIGLTIARVRIKVVGKEKLDGLSRFLIVFNHRSNLDPLATYSALRKYQIAFLSKKENFKVIIFGKLARKCCFKAIDRENPRNAIRTIRDSAELIKANEASVGVYPEGTRSKTAELLPFHDGVFKIASLAEVPVVVGVITGSEKFKKKNIFKRIDVTLKILSVIAADDVKEKGNHEVANMARDMMVEALQGGQN